MRSITADYTEKIVIQPEDVIPKSSWFKCVKYSLVSTLSLFIFLAIIFVIVAESNGKRSSLLIGVIAMIGIILFLFGLIAIVKEHINLILTFAISLIFYLLLLMYSRLFSTTTGIIFRSIIILALSISTFSFAIMIRDWRQIQISRLSHRLMKEAQLAAYNGIVPNNNFAMLPMSPSMTNTNVYVSQYEQTENPYSYIGPNVPGVIYNTQQQQMPPQHHQHRYYDM